MRHENHDMKYITLCFLLFKLQTSEKASLEHCSLTVYLKQCHPKTYSNTIAVIIVDGWQGSTVI